jgi:ATP/ADP translocase
LTIPIIRFQNRSPRLEALGAKPRQSPESKDTLWSDLVEVLSSRYLALLLVSVLLTQIVSNVIDYQFTAISEQAFTTTDTRSVFLGEVYFFINVLGAAVSLATPLLYKTLGVKGSFLTLPVLNLVGTLSYLLFPLNPVGIGLKLTDKGFNYSLDRTSKELFYIQIPGALKFKAKAIIDMFAYRFSKSVSAVLLLGLAAVPFAGAVTAGNCLMLGLLCIVRVYLLRHYRLRVRWTSGVNL